MFEIRRGMPEDAEKIIKYLKIIGTETDNLTFDGGISFTVEQEREYLNMVYNSSRSLYLIAVENDEVIGCASLDTSPRERLKHRGSLGVSVQKKAWGKTCWFKVNGRTSKVCKRYCRIRNNYVRS